MEWIRYSLKFTCTLLAAVMLLVNLPIHVAFAAMIDTETVITAADNDQTRQHLTALIDRKEIQTALTAYGIDPGEARSRIASLTDSELASIAGQLDRIPAGGDGVGTIVGALLIIFLVLLFTDIMGWTDVFTFVKKK